MHTPYANFTRQLAVGIVAALPWAMLTPAGAQSETQSPQAAASGGVEQSAARTRSLSLGAMGKPNGIALTGYSNTAELNTGVRLDELVTRATLRLKATYPPGMRHDQSFIRVYVNNQLAGMAQLKAEKAGVAHWINLDLDPMLFSDYATLKLVYEGTYDSTCIAPENPTLRFDIAADSKLEVESKPIALVDDLAILPAPFFDARDNNRLELPMVLPAGRSPEVLKAAGLIGSWLGAQASYRQARFEVKQAPPDGKHAIVLSTGDILPPGFERQALKGPTLVMSHVPGKPWIKQLYVLGTNEAELLQAAQGLVLESQVLSGPVAQVLKVELGPPRKPYDAPRYVPTNRPVRFAEIMDYPTQLEASSSRPNVALNMRLPPDLFSWAGRNIDMALRYRVTSPSGWNDSMLTVDINQGLVQSFRLAPRSEQSQNRLTLNLLAGTDLNEQEALKIPGFRVSGNNELKFTFHFASEGTHACANRPAEARGAIDPNSTLDFSDLPHYIKMPDLSAFANGGYPFSIYADLSQTAVVLPQQPTQAEVQSYLNLMGLFGQWTGLPGSRVTVLTGFDPKLVEGKHWVALGPQSRHPWLEEQRIALPATLSNMERSMGNNALVGWFENLWQKEGDHKSQHAGRAWINAEGPLGAILGLESPLNKGYSGVLLTGTDELSFLRTVDSLLSYEQVGKIRGAVALQRGEQVQSYRVGDTFVAGALPWWLRVRIAFSEYPALTAIAGATAGVVLAMLLYGWLAGRASRRMKGQ